MVEIRWDLLRPVDIGERFQEGVQSAQRNALTGQESALRQEQQQRQRDTRDASTRAGKHIAAGDYAGAGQQAAASGDMDLMRTIQGLSQEQRAQVRTRNQAMAPLYLQARQLPENQRRAFIASVRDRLIAEYGVPAEQIDNYNPTDQRLDADIAASMTMEQALAQGSVEWEGVAGGEMFATDSRGRPLAAGDPRLRANAPPQQDAPAQPTANVPSGSPLAPPQPAATPTAAGNGQSYTDPLYGQLEAQIGPELGVPPQVLEAIRTRGERSNAGQVSEAGARSVYQFIPETRQAFLNRYGVDAWANPQSAVRAAALHLRESYDRSGDWNRAVIEYHGGTDPRQHGPRTRAYAERVGDMNGQQTAQAGPVPTPGQQPSIQDQAMTGRIPRPAPPGYRNLPDGSQQAITGGPGDQTYQRAQGARDNARQDRNAVTQLLNQFEGNQTVQKFNTVRTAALQIRRLAELAPDGAPGRPQADMALIFAFMRILDPTSTVREGEAASARNAAGVPERIRTQYNNAINGDGLSPNQRNGMLRSAMALYTEQARGYNEVATRYQRIFRSAGVDNPGEYAPTARAPGAEDRRQRQGQQQQPADQIRVIGRRPAR